VTLVAGAAAGAFIVPTWTGIDVRFLRFAVAFLTTANAPFLSELLKTRFASMTGVQLPPDIPTDLGAVLKNSDAIGSLDSVGLNSIAEFVSADPVRLYLNMSQPLGVINGWLDEALVCHHFNLQIQQALHDAGLQTFSEVVAASVTSVTYPLANWRAPFNVTGNAAIDATIKAALVSIVDGQQHHRLLGIIWGQYRTVFFP
jgi:hypothetical protein